MPSRYGRYKPTIRGLTVAAAVLLAAATVYFVFSPAPPRFLSDGYPKTADANGGQRVAVCNPAKLAAIANAVKRATEQNTCAAEAARAKADEDSRAQARSAQANEQATWQSYYQARSAAFQSAIALLVLGASGAAAWAAFQAAHYARYAAVETRRGAKASERALRHDQKVDEVQVRPYVYLASEEIEILEIMDGMISQVGEAKMILRNYGQTPAKSVTIEGACFIGRHLSDEAIEPDPPGQHNPRQLIHLGDMPPGFERERDGYLVIGIASAQFDIKNATRTIFLEGVITYADGAGAKYETRFRRGCTGDDLGAGRFAVTRFGNEAT